MAVHFLLLIVLPITDVITLQRNSYVLTLNRRTQFRYMNIYLLYSLSSVSTPITMDNERGVTIHIRKMQSMVQSKRMPTPYVPVLFYLLMGMRY